jgi:hypothetical protein
MQTRFRIPLLAAALVLILASCSKTNKQGKPVPKDAAIVVLLNGASLSAKLPWDDIKQNALFQEMYADTTTPAFVRKALDNPDNSGIDTKTDMTFFVQKDSLGGIIAFTGTVKDAEKFKLFCLDAAKDGSQSEKDGVSFISKSPVCVGWNKDKFLFVCNAPDMHSNYRMMHHLPDSMQMPVAPASSRDFLATCTNLFNLKESNSLGENEKFTTLVKKSGDIHFWMNAEELNKGVMAGMANNPALAMLNINKLMEGSITTATVNFENGKIVADVKSYAGKELSELYKKYGGRNIDEDMLKRLPQKDVAAVFAMSFKPEGIKEFLKLLGVEGYANMGLAFAGFTLDDFIKANKGDILIAVSDFKKSKDTVVTDSAGNTTMANINKFSVSPDVLFATSIGDKDAFNMLIKAGEKFGKNIPADFPISYNSNGKYFGIGNSKENVDKFVAGTSSNNADFINKITGNPFGGYINLQYLMRTFESDVKDSSAKIAFDASVKMWDNVYMKGGKYEDGGMNQSIEINLLDKNTNSLKQLNQYAGLLSIMIKDKKKKDDVVPDMGEFKAPDSVKIPHPPAKK